MACTQSVIEEVILHFDKLKEVMDKYPHAFNLIFKEEGGYILSLDFDLIETPQKEEDQG